MLKKISTLGLILGAVVGVIVGVLAGKWILWLGAGLVIGWFIGSVRARRLRFSMTRAGREAS